MKLIKYEPNFYNETWSDLESLFERAFELTGRNDLLIGRSLNIPVNLYEDEKNRYVEAELPGIDRSQVNLELENAVLTIQAERTFKRNDSESNESLTRSITVGDDVNSDKVTAELTDGILRVTLPKKDSAVTRKIKIK